MYDSHKKYQKLQTESAHLSALVPLILDQYSKSRNSNRDKYQTNKNNDNSKYDNK
jgi:hypothetical protein